MSAGFQRVDEHGVDALVARSGLVLVGVLAVTGIARGTGLVGQAAASAHHAAAALLLLTTVTWVTASYARATYRSRPVAWLARVGLLACVAALYATGSGLAPGEHGAEGRAHIAIALGDAPAPEWGWVLAAHAGVLAPVAALALVAGTRGLTPARFPARAARVALVLAVSVPLAVAVLLPASVVTPIVLDVEASRAPWPVRALEPLEAALGVPAATLLGLGVIACIAGVPFLDRGTRAAWWRPVVTVTLVLVLSGYVALSLYAGFVPPSDHFHP